MKKTVILVVLALSLSSCLMVTNSMRRFEGRNVTDLYAAWVPPNEVYDDGSGGRVLVYVYVRGYYYRPPMISGKIYPGGTALVTYTPEAVASYDARRVYWVNKDGIVYRWEWKGL